ncbi:MAG: hypothetical protein C0407_03690 [Desulfobacca sp.]|nr:hypothetical protein [Desulfobacca sp.]
MARTYLLEYRAGRIESISPSNPKRTVIAEIIPGSLGPLDRLNQYPIIATNYLDVLINQRRGL